MDKARQNLLIRRAGIVLLILALALNLYQVDKARRSFREALSIMEGRITEVYTRTDAKLNWAVQRETDAAQDARIRALENMVDTYHPQPAPEHEPQKQ